jgi:perosamine synthetase
MTQITGDINKREIPLAKPTFTKEMEKAAVDALRNEHFVGGESVYRFEEEFAEYIGVDFAVSMSSGTAALQIALLASGVTRRQSVITTPASFVATSNAILHANAKPVFADIDMRTYTIDPERVQATIGKETKAIIPVHLYGYPAEMNVITELANKHGLLVIEDACQGHGAAYEGRKAGALGDIGCFSFYPTKNMTVGGDGGMLVTNNERIAKNAAKLRDCGRKSRYVHDVIGYTARLNTANAAIGRVQLKHLDEWNARRTRNAEIYDGLLSDIDEVVLPPRGNSRIHPAYHLYVIRTRNRDGLKSWLESRGVQCGVNYGLPIHLQPAYIEMFGFSKGAYPKSEKLCRTCLSLPMYPDLSVDDLGFVCEKAHDFFKSKRKEG